MRGLLSLGKTKDTYGDLLIPIILGKTPNGNQEKSGTRWTID